MVHRTKADIEWKNRVLCSDGNCIGIIGLDGRCKECGLPYDGELPFETDQSPEDAAPDGNALATGPESQPGTDTDQENAAAAEQLETNSDDEWANRRLCRDGNCIGVIGPDGRCKECGLPYDA